VIRKASSSDAGAVALLALKLWPENDPASLERDFAALLSRSDAAVFLAYDGGTPVGFAQCQLRHDYVEGTESSPVGYLEGIYVIEGQRGKGVARGLLKAAETWAAERGCQEFASDCELDNRESIAFHNAAGFREANRIVCFTKRLRKEKE